MLFYRKYPPCIFLRPFVECFYIWEWSASAETVVESPPTGFASLVVNYGDSYNVNRNENRFFEVPSTFVSGQMVNRYQLKLAGKVGMAGIVFRPTGLASFFDLPMYELTGERICFESILGKQAKQLREQVGEARSPDEKVEVLRVFLKSIFFKKKLTVGVMDFAANSIVENNGIVKVDDLLGMAFMSRRKFERRFFQKVGLSPKYYARIRRISNICHLLATSQALDWQFLIGAGDYYDQAHFSKDFKSFLGVAPSVYAANNVELIKYLNRGI